MQRLRKKLRTLELLKGGGKKGLYGGSSFGDVAGLCGQMTHLVLALATTDMVVRFECTNCAAKVKRWIFRLQRGRFFYLFN